MNYIDNLIEACKKAKAANSIQQIVIENERINEIDRIPEIKDIKMAIYVIEEINGKPEKTFEDFKEFKKNSDRACARLNSPSKILYVGSSVGGLRKRLREHVGDGYKGTYALHLKHWFQGKIKITVNVYEQEKNVLQIIEDDFSDKLKPAFGKKGSNNK